MKKRLLSAVIAFAFIMTAFANLTVSAQISNSTITAVCSNMTNATSSGPAVMTFDLSGTTDPIAWAQIQVTPTYSSTGLGAEFSILKDDTVIATRTVNGYDVMYLDVTANVEAGKSNVFKIVPTSGTIRFENSATMYIQTSEIIGADKYIDYESGTVDGIYSGKETALNSNIRITNDPEDSTNKVVGITLNRSDEQIEGAARSEAFFNNAGGLGADRWYTFRSYLPGDWVQDGYEIITQWHCGPDSEMNEPWRSPMLSLKATGGYYAISVVWDKRAYTPGLIREENSTADTGCINTIEVGAVETGKWVDWTFHVKWSTDSDGLLEVWRDGTNVLKRTGPNTYNDRNEYAMKHGFYKPAGYSLENGPSSRTIYFDNVGILYGNEQVNDILRNTLPKGNKAAVELSETEITAGDNSITAGVQSLKGGTYELNFETLDNVSADTTPIDATSEQITLTAGEYRQVTKSVWVPEDKTENHIVRAYLTDSNGNIVSNSSATAEEYSYRVYDFEDTSFTDSEGEVMPPKMRFWGYWTAYSDSETGNRALRSAERISDGCVVINDLSELSNYDYITMYCKLCVPADSDAYVFRSCASSSSRYNGVQFTSDNKIKVGTTEIGTYTPDTWYEVAVVVDRESETADVYIDGELSGNDLEWTWNTVAHKFLVMSSNTPSGARTKLDDIILTNNPDFVTTVETPVYTSVTYDFEEFTNSNDGMPSGITKGGYIASSEDATHTGNALRFQNTSSYIAVGIESVTAGGRDKILLSSDVKITNAATSAKLFGGTNSSGGTAVGTYISLTADGRIVVCERDPAEKEWDLGAYSTDTWYNIKVLVDTVGHKADIFLNDAIIGHNIDWLWSNYSWLLMRPVTSGGNYSLWLDNLMYTDDPQYFPEIPDTSYMDIEFEDYAQGLVDPAGVMDNAGYAVTAEENASDGAYLSINAADEEYAALGIPVNVDNDGWYNVQWHNSKKTDNSSSTVILNYDGKKLLDNTLGGVSDSYGNMYTFSHCIYMTQGAHTFSVYIDDDAQSGISAKCDCIELSLRGNVSEKSILNPYVSQYVKAARTAYSSAEYADYTTSIVQDYVDPIGGTADTPIATTLEWDEIEGEGSYTLYISKSPYFEGSQTETITDINANSYRKNNLSSMTCYYWKVERGNTQSETESFCTAAEPNFFSVGNIRNVREIGGWTGLNQGLIYRGTEMNNHYSLTSAGLSTMRNRFGIKTDIDLRAAAETDGITSSPLGNDVFYMFNPISPYEDAFTTADNYAPIFRKLSKRSSYPVYYHCWGGADRTGTLSMLIEALCGATEEDCAIDFELTSFYNKYRRRYNEKSYHYATTISTLKAYEGATLREKTENYMKNYLNLTWAEISNIQSIMSGNGVTVKDAGEILCAGRSAEIALNDLYGYAVKSVRNNGVALPFEITDNKLSVVPASEGTCDIMFADGTKLSVGVAEYHTKNYDFEDFTNSNEGMPGGTTKGGYIASSADAAHSGNAMRFQNASSYMAVNIESVTGSGRDKILLSSDVKITNAATSAKLFGGTTSSGGSAGGTYISLTTDGRIVVCERDPAEKECDLGTYSNDTWYNFKVLIDTVNKKADIFLDGMLIGDDIDWIWSSSYSWFVMRPVTSGGNYSLWLDNVMYSDDPQYFPSPIYQLFDFEDFVKLSSPDNTKYTVNGNSLTRDSGYMAAVNRDETDKCLAFQTASSSLLIYPLPDGFTAAKGKMLLSTDIMIKSEESSAALFGFAKNSNLNSHIEFTADQKITAGGTEIGTYTNNIWYNIAVLIDKAAQKADVFLDGKLIGNDIEWTWSTSYDRGRIKALTSGANYDIRIDNLLYTDNPSEFPMYLESVSQEENTINATVVNEGVQEKEACFITALCKGTPENYTVESVDMDNKTIRRRDTVTFTTNTAIPSEDGYFVKAFVWEDIQTMVPVFENKILIP